MRDLGFLLRNVAADFQYLHTVKKRRRNGVKDVSYEDELLALVSYTHGME